MAAAQDLRDQRFARATDREVAPIWHDRFATLAWRRLPQLQSGMVLDVHSGVGRTTAQILGRTGEGVRVVGLEPSRAMRDVAKGRMEPAWKQRVYFKPGDFSTIAEMAEDTYDLVVCNLVLSEAQDTEEALSALLRVTKPGGTVLATFPMAGSWMEAEDIFSSVLHDEGLEDAVARMERLAELRPSGREVGKLLSSMGVDEAHGVVEQERFALLFQSAREFLFSPLVEYGPLRLWKAILGQDANAQQIFFRYKAAIDAYCDRAPFSVSAIAGLLHVRREGGDASRPSIAETYWSEFPNLHALFSTPEEPTAEPEPAVEAQPEVEADELGLDFEIDVEDLAEDQNIGAVPAVIDDEDDTAPRFIGGQKKRSAALISAEDEAIFALLDQPSHRNEPDAELDALLDQVLEFAEPEGAAEASDVSAADMEQSDPGLAPIAPRDVKKPGETLKRIKALLPPPPGGEEPVARPARTRRSGNKGVPPPPPAGNLKRRKR